MSSSTSSSISSLFTPQQFTGVSQYSSDFQSILSRATSIAELPVQQLQNNLTTIQQQETDLTTLGTAVSAVGSALTTLGNLSSGGALTATSSDDSIVTATATGATSGTSYNITLAAGKNNLAGLESAINALGAGVTASVLTTGGTNGNYLSVTADSSGATTLKLIDNPTGTSPTNVLTSANQGSNTNFDLNGVAVSSSSTSVNNVIPGLILNFAGTTSTNETVNLNVAVDSSQISSALQTLVSSYNTLATQETAQIGTGGGSLDGNNIIYQIRQAMSSIVDYQGTDADMGNLANLGIEMSQTGVMSLNQQTFSALSSSQIASGLTLLGTSTTGIGGLQQIFSQITDPVQGTIVDQENQWQTTATNLTNQISTKTAQIQANEQTLDQQLQAADASVADLASQQGVLTASITSLDYTSYGYNTNINSTQST